MHFKRLFSAASVLGLVCGCAQGTPGGPGVQPSSTPQTYTTQKPVVNNSKDSFSLATPVLATSLKQGEKKSATISISRGSEFTDDVQLQFSSIPQGISLDPATPVIRSNEKEVAINVTAANDATVGDYKMKITGHTTKGGPDAQNELKLTVVSK